MITRSMLTTPSSKMETHLIPDFNEWVKTEHLFLGRKLINLVVEHFYNMPTIELQFEDKLLLKFTLCDIISYYYDLNNDLEFSINKMYRLFSRPFYSRTYNPSSEQLNTLEMDNFKNYGGIKRNIFLPIVGSPKTASLYKINNIESQDENKIVVVLNLNYTNTHFLCFVIVNPDSAEFINDK